MYYDIQRASMTRRIPAWILDFILLITLVTGFMWVWSFVFDNTPYTEQIVAIENQYRAEYDGELKVSLEEYEAMTAEERAMFFSFGTVFVIGSFVTMFFVKHGDAKPEAQIPEIDLD